MLTPTQAQERTEEAWRARVGGYDGEECGWCEFTGPDALCCPQSCPVPTVFPMEEHGTADPVAPHYCGGLQVYADYIRGVDDPSAGAQEVYDLVFANRDALIAAGESLRRCQTD